MSHSSSPAASSPHIACSAKYKEQKLAVFDRAIVGIFFAHISSRQSAEKMNVLIVDDDESFCRLLAEILERKGAEVSWTTDSLEGYEMSRRQPYDLFVFDVRMPLFLGTELAEGLKRDRPGTKIILISAFADDSLRKISQKIGVPLLSKPFTAESLLETVESTLSNPQEHSK
jgi:DNA-binding response OmpR family regulator